MIPLATSVGTGVGLYKGGKAAYNKLNPTPPPPPDYMGLAGQQAELQRQYLNEQTQANRPNQSTPYASSQWTQGPNGQWSQQVGFSGPMAGLNASLQQQAADAMSRPFSLDSLGGMPNGEAALKQATNASYGQAESRLTPRFESQESSLRTRLAQQGVQPGSKAYETAMASLGRDRNDAYNQAMFSSQREGIGAGQALFNQGMASRQQSLGEMLRQRGQAMGELQGMQGMLNMPGFSQAGQAQAPNLLGAAGMQDAANMGRYQLSQQQLTDLLGSLTGLLGTGGQLAMMSDERFKANIVRLSENATPGVSYVTFNYTPESGKDPSIRYKGVLAQELQKMAPEHVKDIGGVLHVSPEFAPVPIHEEK